MMFNKKITALGLTSAVMLSAATAFAAEDVEVQQKSLLQKLDSLNDAVLGLRLNGTAKAGGLTSMAESDQFHEESPTQENQAFTDVNLVLTARPSAETKVHLEMHLHKDWQNGFDENVNPMIGHWFSYDGTILNKHVDFNLGYMRVGYTPYTLYTPQQLLLQEPEIFASKRVEALAQRNLDTTTTRLMQGLNADFHSGAVGAISDIHAQVTGARMRNSAKKYDQVFFDFDYADRYFYGLRAGLDAFGAHLGVNYTDVFDRMWTTRTRLQVGDTVIYEDNSVLSVELGFDSKDILKGLPVSFGLNGEFAMANWEATEDYLAVDTIFQPVLKVAYEGTDSVLIVATQRNTETRPENLDLADTSGVSFYVEPFVKLDLGSIKADAKVMYLSNEESFWSEMASSPVYRGNTTVLNGNAFFEEGAAAELVGSFGMSSLENMYFSVYNSNPLNATNLMTSETSHNALSSESEDGKYMYSRLYNNYKNAHFYRNGYKADVLKRLEIGTAMFNIDPTTSIELPYGIATPDRKGINASLNLNWNDAVEVNAIFASLTQANAQVIGEDGSFKVDENGLVTGENKYMRYGAGLGVDVGRIAGLGRKIKIQGSYDHSEEDAYLKRSADRIMAGASIDVYGPFSIQVGYQMSNKEFGNPLLVTSFGNDEAIDVTYDLPWKDEAGNDVNVPVSAQLIENTDVALTKTEESLLLVGPRVKIAPNSYLTVQYGILTDKMTYTKNNSKTYTMDDFDGNGESDVKVENTKSSETLSVDKNVFVADVTVNF